MILFVQAAITTFKYKRDISYAPLLNDMSVHAMSLPPQVIKRDQRVVTAPDSLFVVCCCFSSGQRYFISWL